MPQPSGAKPPEAPSRLYCACGQAKLAMVRDPVPGIHYCVFGHCSAPEPVKGSASAP